MNDPNLAGSPPADRTLKNWNRHQRLVRAAISASPIVGSISPRLRLLWPPIGSINLFAVPVASIAIVLLGQWPLTFASQKVAKKALLGGVLASFLSLLIYSNLVAQHVKCADGQGSKCRAVGLVRTSRAKRMGDVSDEKLLETHGLQDGQVEEMWTSESVALVREELFVSATLCWGFTNFAVGCFARSSFRRI